MRVLLVEDNPGDARLLREMFRDQVSYDAKVTHLDCMADARKHLANHSVDVIVLDLGLPDVRGLETLRQAHAAAPSVPLVVLTGMDDEALAVQTLKEGAQDYLVKGQIETHGLIRALRYAIERKIVEVSITNDLLALRRAEAELRASEMMLRLALDVSDQGVWRWDVGNGTEWLVADARCRSMFGVAPDALVTYEVWINAIIAEDRAVVEASLTRALDAANSCDEYACEYRVVRPDGTMVWVASRGRALFESDPARPAGRRVVQVVGTARDISERKGAEHQNEVHQRELEKSNDELESLSRQLAKARDVAELANRAKSHFLAGMSHELRTPLTGILGYTRLLRIEGGLNATQSGRIDAMLGAGKHLLELITHVLDMAEIESGHVELQATRIDVRTVAVACLDLVRPTAETKGLALSLTVAPGTRHELVADQVRLRQVLLNLLGNAVKFTTRGGVELRLGPGKDGAALRFEVADTGPGIAAGHRQYLFQDFERLDAAATVEGAGLGLALSARQAHLMGGRLGYEDNPGAGSIFWLELPLDTIAINVPVMLPTDGATTPAALHVLVVDDVLMNRDIASSFLRAAGIQVTCVEGGAEAVAAAATTDFDAVLMDVRMPEVDGLEATRRIRALAGPRGRVPIVALTAQAFTDQLAECRAAGMDSHLTKPFEPDTLLEAVKQVTLRSADKARFAVVAPPALKPGAAVMGSELHVIDSRTFDRAAGLFPPETVAGFLRTMAADGENLLHRLRQPDAVTHVDDGLVEATHTLVDSAVMFGFERLAGVGRRFEQAAQSPAEMPAVADGLCAALELTLRAIDDRTSQSANI